MYQPQFIKAKTVKMTHKEGWLDISGVRNCVYLLDNNLTLTEQKLHEKWHFKW